MLLIYFYSQLKSIRTHEKMLRDQVSNNFVLRNLVLWCRDKVCNLRRLSCLPAYCVYRPRRWTSSRSYQTKTKRELSRWESRKLLLQFSFSSTRIDIVRGCHFNRSLWKSMVHFQNYSSIQKVFFSIFLLIMFYVCEIFTPLLTILPAIFAKTVSVSTHGYMQLILGETSIYL